MYLKFYQNNHRRTWGGRLEKAYYRLIIINHNIEYVLKYTEDLHDKINALYKFKHILNDY